MIDLGLMHYCLGVEVWQQSSGIFISQSKYSRALLDKFLMQDCKLAFTPMEKGLKLSAKFDSPPIHDTTYKQLVGNLIYLSATKPCINFTTCLNCPSVVSLCKGERNCLLLLTGTCDNTRS